MNKLFHVFLLFFGAMLFVGADWQTEIAAINIANGWPFGWPLCFPWPSNWMAFDFFRAVRYVIVLYYGVMAVWGLLRER